MSRTNAKAVRTVLRSGSPASDYEDSTEPDLSPDIDTASAVVDEVVACQTRKKLASPSSAATLELMERWLAAAYYTRRDRLYTQRTTSKASGGFLFDGDELEKNPYVRTAIDLDPSGCLNTIIKRRRASMTWLGKPPSAQIPYDQRS